MPLSIEGVPMRKAALWIAPSAALVALALAASACSVEESPPSGPDGGAAITDTRSAADSSVSTEGSSTAEPSVEAGGPRSDVDVAPDETTSPRMDAADVNGPEVTDAAAADTNDDSMAVDSPTDVNLAHDAADAKVADVLDSSADIDAPSVDDDDASTVPIFADCAYSVALQSRPLAIIDATLTDSLKTGFCPCTLAFHVAIHRVLCGSLPPGERVALAAICNPTDNPTAGDHEIFSVSPLTPCFMDTLYIGTRHPLSDWDTLLAEQVGGHPEGGSSDSAAADSDAPVDGSSD